MHSHHIHSDRRSHRHYHAISQPTYCQTPGCPRFAKESSLCLLHFRQQLNDHRSALFTPMNQSTTALTAAQTTIDPPRHTSSMEASNSMSRNARCRFYGCSSYARNGGLCTRHGGGRKCVMANCTTPSQTGGLCRIHGGGSRCKIEGCSKFARVRGLCSSHARLVAATVPRSKSINA
ncbi:hypothetical protein Ae201684P_018772 [Aphanomyces euteiches]|nr:hypothetical protein Ae201684P_018772 [Aphanomyces euteiches]KAH9157215.1 hypothetical protein AeRB84_000942 [Aphanomyces euteiches]